MVRHGQVVGYDGFPVFGHTDVEMTDVGIMQMEHLAERLRLVNISAIYSSDLKRSSKGARIIARHHDVPLHALPELREMHFGDWEGLSLKEIRKRFPDELEKRKTDLVNYQNPGDGESVGHLSVRVMNCFESILADHLGNDILLVGHGAVNRVIICHALDLDLGQMFKIHQDYGCLNMIDYFPDSTLVRMING
jgi:alpha-ribazole phosphatase/probable phosphoglycerate mutase